MARKALGRGLEALIPGRPASTRSSSESRLAELEIERIRPNPRQPRDHFDPASIEGIADSLREHGVLQPIIVRRAGDDYEIIAGERRWRAAQRAGLERIPAVVREATARESLEIALVENLQREDLNPIEEARAYSLLIDEMGLTQEEAAKRVGRERSTVANYLRLLKLPDRVQGMMISGDLSMGHARALLGLPDAAAQSRLADDIVGRSLSVRQVESRVRAALETDTGKRPGKGRDPDVVAAENKLSKALGTRVTIRGGERGRLEIRFTSLDELNRLYERLLELGRS